MRPIIFRAKRKDNGEWVEGDFVSNKYILQGYRVERGFVVPYNTFEVIPSTVGQFTGLWDKHGKKIFEGDIVRHPYLTSPQVVHWNDEWCAFAPIFDARPIEVFPLLSQADEIEVIGNIHDNELLEVE